MTFSVICFLHDCNSHFVIALVWILQLSLLNLNSFLIIYKSCSLAFQELSGQQNGKPFHDVKALTTNGKPKELFFSSDLCAIVEHTKNYLALEDNEIVHIKVFFKGLLVSLHAFSGF